MPTCRHPDIRAFNDVRCCLSCGEPVKEHDEPLHENSWSTRYQYNPLDYDLGQEIRLIEILPGKRFDELQCRIKHVNLVTASAFEAVSYTWADLSGDASLSCTIFCSGKQIPITKNCEAVLRRIRRPNRDKIVWFDAISIDQSNITERNHQVRLMAAIYSSASQVLACVDPNRKHSYALMEWLEWLDNSSSSDSDLGAPCPSKVSVSLLRLPYFERVWVCYFVWSTRYAAS
jgi:hypothetical protein